VVANNAIDASFTTSLPDQRAAVAIKAAMAQLGLPYIWGGNGPAAGDAGFDCSGLTTYAYRVAGIRLPRTAETQYYAGPHVAAGAPLQPGSGNPGEWPPECNPARSGRSDRRYDARKRDHRPLLRRHQPDLHRLQLGDRHQR
jgi:hypothetical protein